MALPTRAGEQTSRDNYMKFVKGDNKFRVLTDAIDGFEYWTEEDGKRKPNRVREENLVPSQYAVGTTENGAKYFIAFLVWNYSTEKAQILEITQVSIIGVLNSHEINPDWGDIKGYDITVKKTGEGKMGTKYEVVMTPPKPFSKDMKVIPTVNLPALFDGEDPFNSTEMMSDKQNDEVLDDMEEVDFGDLD